MSETIEGANDPEAMAAAVVMLADGKNSMVLVVEGDAEEMAPSFAPDDGAALAPAGTNNGASRSAIGILPASDAC